MNKINEQMSKRYIANDKLNNSLSLNKNYSNTKPTVYKI